MSAAVKRAAGLALGLVFALALAPFALAQDAHAAAAPASWFNYEILDEGDEGATYGAGAYIRNLTGDPEGEEVPGSFWDSSLETLTLPATLPDENGVQHPIVYARIPDGYATVLDANNATELRFLNCANSMVETLWVDELTKLEHLDCSVNYLTRMRLTACTQLKHLACASNYLEKLNVSMCANLEYLDCAYNMLQDTSSLQDVATSSLSRTDPQRIDIADATVTTKPVVYDGTEYYWDDPETTVTMPDGSTLLPYDYADGAGDYMVLDLIPHDPADDNGNGNRAGTYTVEVMGLGDPSIGLFSNPWCVLVGTAQGEFVIQQLPLYKANVYLSKYTFAYDGTAKKPTAKVQVEGITQYQREYEQVRYYKSKTSANTVTPKNVGTYYAKVTAKDSANTKGYVYRSFKINPKATASLRLTALNNGLKAMWDKRTAQVTGYQVQYRLKGNTAWKTAWVTNYKNNAKSITGLKDKKTYQVRVRTYKTVDGTKYYSAWTGVKAIKTK